MTLRHSMDGAAFGRMIVSASAAIELKKQKINELNVFPVPDGDTGTNIIGTRHGEKLYETLMTKEERMRSEDMGNYYRVAADNRDLNYDKYFIKGQVHTQADEDYTSHNTRRLDVEGTIKKIMTTEYIQEALKEAGKA
mgnify:CR=1 FL=1